MKVNFKKHAISVIRGQIFQIHQQLIETILCTENSLLVKATGNY